MQDSDRQKAIEAIVAETDEKYGERGWTSIYRVVTLPGGHTESVRILNPKRAGASDEKGSAA